MKKWRNQAKMNLATAGLNDIETAVMKATPPDALPPKEKHVLALVRLAGEGEGPAEHVDAELAKRLQGCRAPKAVPSALDWSRRS